MLVLPEVTIRGLKAKGKYILLLNSDTEVKKGSIDRLLEFAKYHEEQVWLLQNY